MNQLYVLLVVLVSITQSPAVEESEMHISNANNKFTNAFYGALSNENEKKDVFFSPLGIHAVLSMLYQGADDTTKQALATSLHVPEPAETAEGYMHIITHLNNVQNVTLYVANKAYIKEGIELLPEYDNVVRDKFQTQVDAVDFVEEQGKTAANAINGWVNDKTKGKISKLFDPADFDAHTRLVLVNAIYFKGNWKSQFMKSSTRTERFYVDENEVVDVQMMHKLQDGFRYKQDFDLMSQVLELPFAGESVTLTIVLPMERNGIGNLEKRIQEFSVDKIFENMFTAGDIDIRIPKFKLETKIDLEEPLQKLGLGIIFDRYDSNLRKMIKLTLDERLYVTKAIQKAYIEVNEEGAEATAATGAAVGVAYSALPQYEQFHADHPFMVILKEANNILFYGKIMRPVSGDSIMAPTEEKVIELNRGQYAREQPPLYNFPPSEEYHPNYNNQEDPFGPLRRVPGVLLRNTQDSTPDKYERDSPKDKDDKYDRINW